MTVTAVAEMKAASSYSSYSNCDSVPNEQICVEAMMFHSELREYYKQ